MALLGRRGSKAKADAPTATNVDAALAGVVAINLAQPRMRVKVTGQVMRMRARPTNGLPSLAVTISDDTGSVVAVWTGRRDIGGVTLGRKIVVEGVATRGVKLLELTNPEYTLLP
ncbi:MAG: OB-fold nucleic acid binding domain-containing protein [Acidimicrobiia bacterium]